MAKNTIRLTESNLKRVITESVKKVLKEFNISTLYGYPREPKFHITSSKLNILDPFNKFVTTNFDEEMAEDFCNYLYDENVHHPNVGDLEFDDYDYITYFTINAKK